MAHNTHELECREVLARLSDFLDHQLSDAERDAVLAHLAACARCEEFGGAIAAVVRELRGQRAHTLPAEVEARLRDALHDL